MKTAGKIILGFILGVSAVAAVMVGAHRGGWDGGYRGEHFAERMLDRAERKLDLNVEQRDKLAQVIAQIHQVRDEFRQQREQDSAELMDLIAADTLDQSQVLALIDSKTTLVTDNAPEVVAAIAAFTDSLSPAQKREITDLLEWRLGSRHWH